MSRRADSERLKDIQEAIQRIESYVSGISYEDFLDDFKTQDAVIRNIEIMGEAAKGVSEAVRETLPNVPWRNIAGMRDRLIHSPACQLTVPAVRATLLTVMAKL